MRRFSPLPTPSHTMSSHPSCPAALLPLLCKCTAATTTAAAAATATAATATVACPMAIAYGVIKLVSTPSSSTASSLPGTRKSLRRTVARPPRPMRQSRPHPPHATPHLPPHLPRTRHRTPRWRARWVFTFVPVGDSFVKRSHSVCRAVYYFNS